MRISLICDTRTLSNSSNSENYTTATQLKYALVGIESSIKRNGYLESSYNSFTTFFVNRRQRKLISTK